MKSSYVENFQDGRKVLQKSTSVKCYSCPTHAHFSKSRMFVCLMFIIFTDKFVLCNSTTYFACRKGKGLVCTIDREWNMTNISPCVCMLQFPVAIIFDSRMIQ